MCANQFFAAKIEIEHATLIEMKKVIKSKSHQQTSDIIISKNFLRLTRDQQNERIINRTPESLNRSKTVSLSSADFS
jgi:polyphosphate kinase 2 (PPK2 family)